MDDVTKGTWLINSYKHLLAIRQDAPELSQFEATDAAGRSGALLARLVADASEVVPADKVKAFARQSGIRPAELQAHLQYLKNAEKIDFVVARSSGALEVEVYCFSTQDAITTTAAIYDDLGPSEYEKASLVTLDETFLLPRSDHELIENLTSAGYSEEVAEATLSLQESLELVKVSRERELNRPVFYNEHAFSGDPQIIVRALSSLKSPERQEVEDIQRLVDSNPAYPLDELEAVHSPTILRMMEGIGLLDGTPVKSEHGEAVFVTGPQLKGIAIDVQPLSVDVFHKAKVLLSCLRFGQLKSESGRGKITTEDKMLNIVNKLLRGDWVGPCTAIGQDYQVLEIDGVIETRRATHGWYGTQSMYEMRLRQREVGVLVRQMLTYQRVLSDPQVDSSRLLFQEPVLSYTIPEMRRREIVAKQTKPVKEIRDRLLQALRTGVRRP